MAWIVNMDSHTLIRFLNMILYIVIHQKNFLVNSVHINFPILYIYSIDHQEQATSV
jgi:hypothetical protein